MTPPHPEKLSWSDRNPQLSRPVRFHDGVKGGMNKLKQPTACQEMRIEQLPMEPLAKFSSLQPLGAISDGAPVRRQLFLKSEERHTALILWQVGFGD